MTELLRRVLAKLADEALAEFHAGTTLELDPDDL